MKEAEADSSVLGVILVHSHPWKSTREYRRFARIWDAEDKKMVKMVDSAKSKLV